MASLQIGCPECDDDAVIVDSEHIILSINTATQYGNCVFWCTSCGAMVPQRIDSHHVTVLVQSGVTPHAVLPVMELRGSDDIIAKEVAGFRDALENLACTPEELKELLAE